MTAQEYLIQHGKTEGSVKKFGIEITPTTIRISIKDINGKLLFHKVRLLTAENKFIFNPKGSLGTIFNSEILKNNSTIYLTEGEIDCIRLNQEGLPAVSGTNGAKTFKEDWAKFFEGKEVIICYDTDEKGIDGVNTVVEVLRKAKVCYLPKDVKDICEYLNKYTVDDFKKIILIDKQKEEPPSQQYVDSILIGEPIPWSKFTESENTKEWIWENYIAKGNITLLSALWKAGKSTFLRNLFVAISEQREFAGHPTTRSKILVVSEEDSGEWYSQKADLEDEQIEHILVWSRPIRMKPNLKQWIELIEALTIKCLEEKVDAIVIDTITTFWPIDNENDSAQVIKALVPLYSFTENHIAVVLVHHFRKGGGDQAQASRGSGALPGFVDNIIEFTRKEDGLPTQRVLKTYGRFDAVIPMVVIDLTDDGYIK